jgi:hypothetical protein
MVSLCAGVNIKTDKAGGAINSIRAGLTAKEKKL